jgi:hypothetical protein
MFRLRLILLTTHEPSLYMVPKDPLEMEYFVVHLTGRFQASPPCFVDRVLEVPTVKKVKRPGNGLELRTMTR